MPDIFLRSVPSDANRADVRLYDPTTADIGGALTANLAVTEADDLLASTSMLALSAALAVTEADDALTAAAVLVLLANLAATEADDALSSTATLASSSVTADLSVTEEDDALSSTAQGGLADPGTKPKRVDERPWLYEVPVEEYAARSNVVSIHAAPSKRKQKIGARRAPEHEDDEEAILMLLTG